MKVVDTAASMDCDEVDSTAHMEVNNFDKEKLAALKKEEGNKLYSSQDYAGAIELYTEAIDLQPTNFAYYGNRCACYIMKKDFQSALNDARKSTLFNDNFTKGYIREAKCHMTLGSASFAKRCLLKALEVDPSNQQAKLDMKTAVEMMQFESQAQDGEESQDYRKVEYCMRRLTEYVPDCKKYKATQAEAMALQGKIEEAQNLSNEILRNDISVVEALYVRGLCLYYQDNNAKSYKIFQEIFKLDPDYRKAKEVYRKIKLLEKTKESGNNAYRSGRYREAYDLYTQALAVDPCNKVTNAKLHSNRANVCEKLNRIEDAIEDCNKAIEYDPKFVKPILRRAKCYMLTEKYEDAVRDYEKLVRLEKNPEYRQLLREAKFELKKSKRKDYYKILGVPKTATDDVLKKAYRKEALAHHPDRHSHDSEEKQKDEEKLFKDVNEAYSILSDKQKRMRYDNGQDLDDPGFDMEFDPNQIFQTFFGGSSSGGSGFSFAQGGGFPGGFSFSFG